MLKSESSVQRKVADNKTETNGPEHAGLLYAADPPWGLKKHSTAAWAFLPASPTVKPHPHQFKRVEG
jgi:hypothetical protein